MKKISLLVMILMLAACANEKNETAQTVCSTDPFPFQFTYFDGQDLKSERVVCSNGCTTIKSLDAQGLTETICQ